LWQASILFCAAMAGSLMKGWRTCFDSYVLRGFAGVDLN
jgi:hypothetical protein